MFDYKGGKNFTGFEGAPDPSRWTGKDLFANYNVFSMAFELPTRLLGANPAVRFWGRVSIRRAGKLVAVDRSGHPTFANFFFTDEIKPEFNQGEPAHDREHFLGQMIHTLEHVGGYSSAEARALIDAEGILPDMLSFDPSKPGGYPNGRLLTDHIVAHRLAMLSKGKIPPTGSSRTLTSSRASHTSAHRTRIPIRPPRKGDGRPCLMCPASRRGNL